MNTPLSTMEKTSIKINLEGGPYLELQSPSKDVSNDLYTLSQEGCSYKIPDLCFECRIPPFGKTHMLVETPRTAVGSPEVVVYGVKCEQEARMTPEQVANRVLEAFEVNVQENITALISPDGISVERDGESAYPCGTLFTSGQYSRSSGSSGSCWSPGPPTPENYHTPTPSQRPLRLPITNNANVNANSCLTTPHPVATPNSTIPNHALVAGTGSFNMAGDQCDQALEDSILAPEINCREGMVAVQTAHHQTLLPAQKVQAQEAGEFSVDPVVIVLETPSKPNTQFKMTVEENSAAAEKSLKPPVELSSEESEGGLNSIDKKALNNQLVVGIGQQRSSLVPPSFGRQRSLPGPEKAEKNALPRNASDACLVALGEDRPSTQRSRRFSDVGLNLKVSACEQTVDELPKETPPSPTKDTMTTPTKDTLGTPTKDTLATSPTKPLAIERQESVADPGQIEYVLPRPTNVVLRDQSPQDAHKAVMNMLYKVVEDENENEEVSVHSSANCEGGDACDPGEACDSSGKCESGGINFQVVPTSNDSTGPSSDPPEQASAKDAKLVQVHLLEHAMNGYCMLKDACKAGAHGNLEFTQAVDQMRAMVDEAQNSRLDEDLKEYILLHCRECRDKECKVPHMMAGCPPPGESFSGSETDQTDSPQRSSSPYQESPVTFDQEANQSTSSECKRHQEQAQYLPTVFQPPLTPVSYGQPTSNMYTEGTDVGVQPSQDQTAPFSPLFPRRNGPPILREPMRPPVLNSPSMFKHFRAEGAGSGLVSPMGSTGFLVPGANPRGNHHQESQLGAESYIQQVSDKRQTDIKPREKGQYQYIEPSRSGSGLRKMYGAGENRHVSVKAGQFPSYQALPKKPGTVIYAAQGSDLIPGENYPCPQSVPERDRLGKGGNGTVVKFPLGGTEYALKLTQYREGELNTWSQLNHPNIVPLLGVMMADRPHCYQFMPRMTGDLRSMMIDHGDLLTHLKKNSKEWVVVMRNTVYILREVLRGLRYLHSLNIQHSDFKANNVLIMKRCSCPDILHCVCDGQDKYEVKIADFDSLKKSKFSRSVVQFSEICREPMNDLDMNGVKGTPAYRAPEQFKDCQKRSEFKRTLEDGKVLYDMEGPWCDMWSVGVVVLQMVLGSHNKGPYISEASILTSCKADKMHPRVEAAVATLRRSQLHSLALTHPELKPLALIAEECLKVDCRMRSTAEAVLTMLEDLTLTL